MKEYLTENSLGTILETLFGVPFIHNKCFMGRYKPDYRNDELMLIVEFDGYAHYCNAKRIKIDKAKDKLYKDNGYKVVHIPYFVQLSKGIIEQLFGSYENLNITEDVISSFPQGFISNEPSCVLPSDFNELGTYRFIKDLNRFSSIKDAILQSLKDRIEKNDGDWELVVNSSIFLLLS